MGSEQFFCKNKAYNCYYEKYSDGSVKNIQDEIPFDLPAGWAWSKISAISFVTKLAGFEYTNYIADNLCNDGIPLFKGKNVQDGKIIYEFESYIPLNISNALPRSQISRKCLLTPYVGTIGNIGIHNKQGIYHLGSNVGKIELYNQTEVLLEEYVVAYMKSTYGYKELTKHIKATAQASISIDAIRDVYIAIPPSNEQIKISNKIDEIFSFISVVENSRKEIEDIKTLLKSKILELAIQGKLVPQDESDEPASVLLEHIRAERKAKLGKKYVESFIYKGDDNCYYENNVNNPVEIPFVLPKNWAFSRLADIAWLEDGVKIDGEQLPYLDAKTIRGKQMASMLSCGKVIKKGMQVILVDGENSGEVFEVPCRGYIGSTFKVLQVSSEIEKSYVKLILDFYKNLFKDNKTGSAIPHLNKKIFKSLIVAIPPVSEQKLIVEKVNLVTAILKDGV